MLCVLLCALTAKGWFLAAWVMAGCPPREEYDYEERNGKIYAVHRRSGLIGRFNHARPILKQHRFRPLSP
jgi:hypothetical protein